MPAEFSRDSGMHLVQPANAAGFAVGRVSPECRGRLPPFAPRAAGPDWSRLSARPGLGGAWAPNTSKWRLLPILEICCGVL